VSGIQIVSLLLILFAVGVITLGIIKVHTYPGRIAEERKHPQAKAIEVTSLLGLIAFPLWMFALIWAYAGVIGVPVQESPHPAEPSPQRDDDTDHEAG
jgi:hypothetical protein